MLFPTTLVGSYPQPDWLIDRQRLAGRFPPRVRVLELWRVPQPLLQQAQDDATLVAIKAQEDAGLDIISDGEIRRESYSNLFANALEGVDLDNPGTALDRSGHPNPVPRVVGNIRRKHAVGVRDLEFLLANTDRRVKVTVPGPFTMAQQAQIDHYGGERRLAALDYAAAVNAEIKELFRYAAIIHARPSGYSFLSELAQCSCRQISIETAQSNLDCSVLTNLAGKKIILGVIDLSSPEVETPEKVAARIERALPHVAAEDIIVAPDCGMKYLSRDVAFGKLQSMVAGARMARMKVSRATKS